MPPKTAAAPAKAAAKPAAKVAAAPKAAAPAPKAAAPAPKAAAPKVAAAPKEAKARATGNQNGVYVKNWGTGSVQNATEVFAAAGKVVSVQVRRHRYAIIFFDAPAAVKKAIDLFHEKEVLGSVVTVVPAKTSPRADPHEGSSVVFVAPICRESVKPKEVIQGLFAGYKVMRLRIYKGQYAYVYLDSPAAALKIIKEKSGSEFHGKNLTIKLSTRSLEKDVQREAHAKLLMEAHVYKKEHKLTK